MKKRMLPFGYEYKETEVAVDAYEADIVRSIFQDYVNGISLGALAKRMNEAKVCFNATDKPWNKTRVFHIITDRRYIGGNYPAIISQELYDKANVARCEKTAKAVDKTDEIRYVQKIIYCGRCGKPFVRKIDHGRSEYWTCSGGCLYGRRFTDKEIMNGLTDTINKIDENNAVLEETAACGGYDKDLKVMQLSNEVLRISEQATPSFAVGKQLIFQLASEKFNCCREDKSVYTGYVKGKAHEATEKGIDVMFLKQAVVKIKVLGASGYSVVFKNGAEITNNWEEKRNECKVGHEDRSQSVAVPADR